MGKTENKSGYQRKRKETNKLYVHRYKRNDEINSRELQKGT